MEFEAWIAEQGEDVRKMLEAHEAGLKSALQKERDATAGLKRQVEELKANSGDVESKQKTLEELTAKLQAAQGDIAAGKTALETAQAELGKTARQRDFYKAAGDNGVANVDDAFLIAQGKPELWNEKGAVKWNEFRKSSGYLFQTGQGGGQNPANPGRGVTLTLEEVKRMTPAEYLKNKEAVDAVLAQTSK